MYKCENAPPRLKWRRRYRETVIGSINFNKRSWLHPRGGGRTGSPGRSVIRVVDRLKPEDPGAEQTRIMIRTCNLNRQRHGGRSVRDNRLEKCTPSPWHLMLRLGVEPEPLASGCLDKLPGLGLRTRTYISTKLK